MCIYKKIASRGNRRPKPRARPLHAEVPCNYLLGRLAAALQNVFVLRLPLPLFFQLVQIIINQSTTIILRLI